jgi:glycosyltransferase involved in cell wall biosynthesis
MDFKKKRSLIFMGYNNMFTHKRGVENVIHFQSKVNSFTKKYYLHWDTKTHIYKYDKLLCIGIKHDFLWVLSLNVILLKLKKKDKNLFIHSHNPLMSIMCFFQTNLLTVHDGLYYLSVVTKHKLNKLFWLLEKIVYLRSNYVHFISNYTKKMSLYRYRKNYSIVPNTSHFERFEIKSSLFNHNLRQFDKDALKVFIVRSIEERALINLIIDVAEKKKTKNIEFLIAGKGPLLEFYRNKIKNLGLENITLLGYVPDNDLIHYYNNCDVVLISAAYGEGFGLPIIEGYLFNKPVIASNVCAISEVVFSTDFLFENTAESIVSKLNFSMEQLNKNYRDYYDNCFSNKVVISKMEALYSKL